MYEINLKSVSISVVVNDCHHLPIGAEQHVTHQTNVHQVLKNEQNVVTQFATCWVGEKCIPKITL